MCRIPLAHHTARSRLLLALALGACTTTNPAYRAVSDDGAADSSADASGHPDIKGRDVGPPPPSDAAAFDDTTRPPTDAAASGVAMDAAAGAASLKNGLIGYWNMDEVAGSAIAHDGSGNGNDGTLETFDLTKAWVAGHSGMALAVDGSTTRAAGIKVPTTPAIDALQRVSAAAWIYDTDVSTVSLRSIISRQISGGDDEVFNMTVWHGSLRIYMPRAAAGAVSYAATAPAALPHDQWIHVAFSYDGVMLRLYQNGVQVASTSYSAPLPSTTTPLYLATNKNTSNGGEAFVGLIDDLVLYARALSPAEIAMLAAGQHP